MTSPRALIPPAIRPGVRRNLSGYLFFSSTSSEALVLVGRGVCFVAGSKQRANYVVFLFLLCCFGDDYPCKASVRVMEENENLKMAEILDRRRFQCVKFG